MENKLLRLVYTLFLGLVLAVFDGMGIATFYESPKQPEYPIFSDAQLSQVKTSPEVNAAQIKYEQQYRQYEKVAQAYHRNVSIIAMIAAVVLLVISFWLERKNSVVTNGVMLGGVFTLIYGIGRGIASTDTKYTFIAVSVSLAVILYLGYHRFGGGVSASVMKEKKYSAL